MDDGLLDVFYIMNPGVDTLPKLVMGLEKDCQLAGATGRFRCAWLKVDCPEGLQVRIAPLHPLPCQYSLSACRMCRKSLRDSPDPCCLGR